MIVSEKRLAEIIKGRLEFGESRGWVHRILCWPSAPPEQDAVTNMWRMRGYIIAECLFPSIDVDRWAIREVYWEELKALGQHLEFAPTGLMCGGSRWSIGQEQSKKSLKSKGRVNSPPSVSNASEKRPQALSVSTPTALLKIR